MAASKDKAFIDFFIIFSQFLIKKQTDGVKTCRLFAFIKINTASTKVQYVTIIVTKIVKSYTYNMIM